MLLVLTPAMALIAIIYTVPSSCLGRYNRNAGKERFPSWSLGTRKKTLLAITILKRAKPLRHKLVVTYCCNVTII